LLEQKYTKYPAEGLLKVNTTSDPSVAEAGVIVATVGALLLSIMARSSSSISNAEVSSTSSIVSAVVGTDTVPVVAQQERLLSRL
jgi:hypothetical protein